MQSAALKALRKNMDDVRRLLELHQEKGGTGPGRRHRLEVLNKSGILLLTAFWEAYCEDLAAECLEHIVTHARDSSALGKEIRKRIAVELKGAADELAIWQLSGDGWKTLLRTRLTTLTAARNRRLNSPSADLVDEFFLAAVGLPHLSQRWSWQGMNPKRARDKLSALIALRGDVAHRGQSARSITRDDVLSYTLHIIALVEATESALRDHCHSVTNKTPW